MTDFGATLFYSHLRPDSVAEVIAGWEHDERKIASSGYVVKLTNGRYAYIHSERNDRMQRIESSTTLFDREPTFIYDRARDWNFNKEELNADFPRQKQDAKYLIPARAT